MRTRDYIVCRPVKYPDTHGSSYKSEALRAPPSFLRIGGSKYFPRAGKMEKARDRYLKGS